MRENFSTGVRGLIFNYPENMYGVTLTPLNVIKEAVNKRGCRNFEFIHNNFNTITLPELIFHTETYLDNYANSDNKSKLLEIHPKVHARIPVNELVKTETFLVNSRDEEIQVQIYAKRQLIIDLNSDGLPIE